MATLIKFEIGSTEYNYNSGEVDITYDSDTYEAIYIERSELFFSLDQNEVTIRMQKDKSPASELIKNVLLGRVKVTLRNTHSSNHVLFKGYVVSCNNSVKAGVVTLKCSRFPEGLVFGNSRALGSSCPWAWGQGFTDLDPSALGGTVAVSGTAITGTGTTFTSHIAVGDVISAGKYLFRIKTITDNTNAVSENAAPAAVSSGTSYYKVTSGTRCMVNREAWKITVDITDAAWALATYDGTTRKITGPGGNALFANGGDSLPAYRWGRAVFKNASGTILEYGFVTIVNSDNIIFAKPIVHTSTSDAATTIRYVDVYAGCSKKHATCSGKFNAAVRYGGLPRSNRIKREVFENSSVRDTHYAREVFGCQWVKGVTIYSNAYDVTKGTYVPPEDSRSRNEAGPVSANPTAYISYAQALARRTDHLLGIREKQGTNLLEGGLDYRYVHNTYGAERTFKGRIAWPTHDATDTALSATNKGSGNTVPLEDAEEFYFDVSIALTVPESSDALDAKASYNFRKHNGKILTMTTRAQGDTKQKAYYYTGVSPTICDELVDSEKINAYPDLTFPEISYVFLGQMVVDERQSRVNLVTFSADAYYGTYERSDAIESSLRNAMQSKKEEKKPSEIHNPYEYLVYHAPVISSYHVKDFIFKDFDDGRTRGETVTGSDGSHFLNPNSAVNPDEDPRTWRYWPGMILKVGSYYYIIKHINIAGNTITLNSPLEAAASGASVSRGQFVGANPSNIIYYILTELLNIPASDIDTTSFTDARDQLYSEGVGINPVFDYKRGSSDFIVSKVVSILDVIAGDLYWGTTAGKWFIALRRKDNYGSQTNNTIVDDLNLGEIKNLTYVNKSIDSLYSHLSIVYNDGLYSRERNSYDVVNEVTRDLLGYDRRIEVSNEYITDGAIAKFFAGHKFDEVTGVTTKVSFKLPSHYVGSMSKPALASLHQGALISITDSHSDTNFKHLRIDKVSAYNEFNDEITVTAHTDRFRDGDFLSGPESGVNIVESVGAIDKIEIVPLFFDTPEIGPSVRTNGGKAFVLANFNPDDNVSHVQVTFDSEEAGATTPQKVSMSMYGVLNAQLLPGGVMDNSSTGILFTVPAGHKAVGSFTNEEYVRYAIISRNATVLGTTTFLQTDYELIAFKNLTETTAPTAGATGEYRITDIARNIAGPIIPTEPYSSGTSYWLTGKTDITGQFEHSAGSHIFVLPLGGIDKCVVNTFFEPKDSDEKHEITANASPVSFFDKIGAQTQVTYDHTYENQEVAAVDGDNTMPFKWKPYYPVPPTQVICHKLNTLQVTNSPGKNQDETIVLYISSANLAGGADWRNPEGKAGIHRPQMDLLIEVNNEGDIELHADRTPPLRHIIKPEDDFFANMMAVGKDTVGGLPGAYRVPSLNSFYAGYIRPESSGSMHPTTGSISFHNTSYADLNRVDLANDNARGGKQYLFYDNWTRRDVTGFACFVFDVTDITGDNTPLKITVSHIHPITGVKGISRTVTIAESAMGLVTQVI